MKRTVRTLCAFLSAAMLASSQALAADTVTETQTQKPSIVINEVESDANGDVAGKLIDQNTGSVFEAARYPNAVAGGVFFVVLEDNGHVYAYILNEDETVVQIADIDAGLGDAMALDYDTYEDVL